MSKKSKDKLVEQLVQKSREVFIMGLEVFNKPTLKYRVEGFAFFVCNAWELMLKAEMVKQLGEGSIYFKDHPERTISIATYFETIKHITGYVKLPLSYLFYGHHILSFQFATCLLVRAKSNFKTSTSIVEVFFIVFAVICF